MSLLNAWNGGDGVTVVRMSVGLGIRACRAWEKFVPGWEKRLGNASTDINLLPHITDTTIIHKFLNAGQASYLVPEHPSVRHESSCLGRVERGAGLFGREDCPGAGRRGVRRAAGCEVRTCYPRERPSGVLLVTGNRRLA